MDFRNFKNWFGFKWTVKIKPIINYRKIWFLFNGYSAAGDQKWARGQLKYDGFPVRLVRKMMWSPKKTKKVFTEILTVFPVEIRCSKKKKVFRLHILISQCLVDGPPLEHMGPLSSTWARWSRRPSWSPWAPGSFSPCPPSRRLWMAIKTINCLSFIVLNNFFANMSVKKNCASPTKSLTARHCYLVTAKSQKRKKQLYYPFYCFVARISFHCASKLILGLVFYMLI